MFVLVGDVCCWWGQRWRMVVGKCRIAAGRVVRLIETASCIMNDV